MKKPRRAWIIQGQCDGEMGKGGQELRIWIIFSTHCHITDIELCFNMKIHFIHVCNQIRISYMYVNNQANIRVYMCLQHPHTHFMRGASGGTAVIGRETPGRGWVRGTRARWGGKPGVPFNHHTIVLTKASGGRSHISPLPENVAKINTLTSS